MKSFFYFCFIMIIGFSLFVVFLLFIAPLIGLKTFVILVILLILGFFIEFICK
ncbi:hypothetical protein GI584_20605 [Gracilibacillus salitolerans]|uniref:Uncharacterized protein n=1 Tax=Gracilibacillus salitolerans TaxID=2663022 RepID=A0A5Q2TNJ9_9BACI|nr:hypothetical protein [Gracilibacillus salitolerans]QGH36295.1 hypothetical protein GI584_20605 [Gracilibacillus salitolerans]